MRPLPCAVTETWPYWLRSSRIWSRRSSRSLGLWPASTASSIALLSCARLVAAALIGPVAPVMLLNSAVASAPALVDLAGQAAEGVGQRLGGRVDGLLGAVGLGVVGEVAPGGVELAQQRVDARGRRLADGALHAVERLGAGRGVAQRHVLRADLEVQEGVADAAVGGDVDALAEERAGAVLRGAGRQVQRVGRAERGLLARVADGVGVGDVVRGDVERLLLGQEAAQRGLQSEEARDHGQACRSRVRKEACVLRAGDVRHRAPGEVAVAGVGLGAQLAHQVVEEGELLAHEDAVDRVLADDLGQQAAQLGGALEGRRPPAAGASRSASDSMVTVWGGMPSAVPAVVRIAVRVPSRAARRPISAWMSARRAMTSSTSRARIDWPWRRTTLSSRRAEAIWASRWPMTSSPRPGERGRGWRS